MKLYVGNLPFSATQSEIHELFAQHGEVADVALINDRETGRPRGFGFVEMPNADEANAAMSALNGQDFNGRALNINEAREREGGGGGRGGRGGFGGGGGGRGGFGGGGGRGGFGG
ncbi:MAG: RNA recognition motif domain-containing protein, partial [Phycisphaerales bacterium]